MRTSPLSCLLALVLTMTPAAAMAVQCHRRVVLSGSVAAALSAMPAFAEEEAPRVLTEEEMAARVARKQELLRKSVSSTNYVSATDVRSDINPDAAVALRGRTLSDNMKSTVAKQKELKNRDKATKRDDMCEMLGRGC